MPVGDPIRVLIVERTTARKDTSDHVVILTPVVARFRCILITPGASGVVSMNGVFLNIRYSIVVVDLPTIPEIVTRDIRRNVKEMIRVFNRVFFTGATT